METKKNKNFFSYVAFIAAAMILFIAIANSFEASQADETYNTMLWVMLKGTFFSGVCLTVGLMLRSTCVRYGIDAGVHMTIAACLIALGIFLGFKGLELCTVCVLAVAIVVFLFGVVAIE